MPDRHITERTADGLIDEAAEAAFHGWDFSWLEGRSDDPKTPWRYRALSAEALSRSTGVLDIDQAAGGRSPPSPPSTAPSPEPRATDPTARSPARRFEPSASRSSASSRRPTTSTKRQR